jgi:hypothetical protein
MSIKLKSRKVIIIYDSQAKDIAKRIGKTLKVKTFSDKECKIISYNDGYEEFEGL